MLARLNVTYDGAPVDEPALSATSFPHYFAGSELVVAGRFAEGGPGPRDDMTAEVTAEAAGGRFERRMRARVTETTLPAALRMERMWAYLTIRRLLDTVAVSSNSTVAATAKTRTLDLSLRVSK